MAIPIGGKPHALRATKDAEYVIPLMELTELDDGAYRIHARVRVESGETLHLAFEVNVKQRTYTTRVLTRRFQERITTQSIVCNHRYANIATYDPVNIELARTTNLLRWTADTYNGTVTPFRGSGSCFANPYTTVGTTWYVTSCYLPPASGFGSWTNASSEEAFLWIDLDENHRVDNGAELFGTSTLLPSGARAANGFAALAVYDDPAHGGDGNGVVAVADHIWGRLRLWVDRNHDGQSTHDELATLAQMGVTALQLGYDEGASLDDAENDHRFRGHYLKRLSGNRTLRLLMNDVFFWAAP